MAKKSNKNAETKQANLVLSGGLNLSKTPVAIEDNEVVICSNFIYEPDTECLIVRPGSVHQTIAACDGTNGITSLYYYEKDASNKWLVASCGATLYYLNGTGWEAIGPLADGTTVPSYLTANAKLMIADGSTTGIRMWDGTTYDYPTTSPDATALHMIKNRVVCNSKTEPDSVYMSKTEDEEDWDTAGDAIGLRAGFGDNMSVVGFNVFGQDLVVHKTGDARKKAYRTNVADATATNWYVQDLSENNSAQNAQSTTEAWNNAYFVDSNGFKSVKGVDIYGDIQVDQIGKKINSLFQSNPACDFCKYVPTYNAIWFGIGNKVYSYTERVVDGKYIPAFTEMTFAMGRIRDVCDVEGVVYLAGNDGWLYKIDESLDTDCIGDVHGYHYSAIVRTKTLQVGDDFLLKKLQMYFKPKMSGAGAIKAYGKSATGKVIKTVTLASGGTYLYDSTGDLNDATTYLADEGDPPWIETTRNRVRDIQMAFELIISTGRCTVEWMRAEFALLEGGD